MTPAARRQLIERHLPLVRSIARRYAGAEPLEDLVQVGAIGLIKAADRFDAARGVAFGAYAAPFVAGEIRHHLRDRCAPVRVPRRLQARGRSGHRRRARRRPTRRTPIRWSRRRTGSRSARRCGRSRPDEREVVQLRFVEDLSQAQIARRIGRSQVHVSRTLRGALLRLHEQLAAS